MGLGTELPIGASTSDSVGQRDAGKGAGGFDFSVTSADTERGCIDVIPDWDPSAFVLVDDLEEKVNMACLKLGVDPPKFFPLPVVRLRDKDHFTYGVHLQSTPSGVDFLVSGRYSTDKWLARQDAAFITLEWLLEESGKKIWDFNSMVAGHFRDQAAELRRLRTVPLPKLLSKLEEELTHLKEQLARYTDSPHNS